MKADYKHVKLLREKSGFGWDEAKQQVTATDDVWEPVLKVSLLGLYILIFILIWAITARSKLCQMEGQIIPIL
jgi:hypothetical protein